MTENEATTDGHFFSHRWHTSSYTQERGECVEVAEGPFTGIRDSFHPDHAALYFGAREWSAFITAARDGVL